MNCLKPSIGPNAPGEESFSIVPTIRSIVRTRVECITGEQGPVAAQEAEIVHERCEDSLHGPKHGAEAQVEQH